MIRKYLLSLNVLLTLLMLCGCGSSTVETFIVRNDEDMKKLTSLSIPIDKVNNTIVEEVENQESFVLIEFEFLPEYFDENDYNEEEYDERYGKGYDENYETIKNDVIENNKKLICTYDGFVELNEEYINLIKKNYPDFDEIFSGEIHVSEHYSYSGRIENGDNIIIRGMPGQLLCIKDKGIMFLVTRIYSPVKFEF